MPASNWPLEVKEISITSSVDQTPQLALWYAPPTVYPVPLLVALHTWSFTCKSPEPAYAHWCIKNRWAMVRPNFRGPNNNPDACGSELAVADIVDAVEYAKREANINPQRIYLAGASGGAYAALLLAGRHPEIWAGVTAWCPIEDLATWHAHHSLDGKPDQYAKDMEVACGGAPGSNSQVDEQYRKRSPSAWIAKARGLPLDINAGIFDGHRGSVPVCHSLRAFNLIADKRCRVPEHVIALLKAKPEVPAELKWHGVDLLYPRGRVLFRKISGFARVTLFEGAHEMYPEAAFAWLSKQQKGQQPVWEINEHPDEDILRDSSETNR